MPRRVRLEPNLATLDEIEMLRRVALVKNARACGKVDVRGVVREHAQMRLAHAGEERMRSEEEFVEVQGAGSGLVFAGDSRMARTSSVISIATGHQVMQRPQPTQPDEPNWSIHVASLCVSHWR